MFYKNYNYGGNLQAYALCRVLNALGYDADQIKYAYYVAPKKENDDPRILSRIKKTIVSFIKNPIINAVNKKIKIREQAFERFTEDNIKHTEDIYNDSDISKCVEKYDVFVCGSDQVWNTNWYNQGFFLEFVKEKPKVSYAASLGRRNMTEKGKDFYTRKLSSFKAISVREENAKKMLEDFLDVKISFNLDPTLLLNKNEWDEICSKNLINQKYCFCYFLSDNKNERIVAKQYAKKHKLKLVTLPHLRRATGNDLFFGDIQLFDITPGDFVSLIKNAECVMTDSFHASVFSIIYDKQFFVFGANASVGQKERIINLISIFKCENHFCDGENETFEYIETVKKENYNFSIHSKMKEESLSYIKENI